MINLRHIVLLASCTVALYVIDCRIVQAQRLADNAAANGQLPAAPNQQQRPLASIVDRHQQERQRAPGLHWTPVKDYKPPIDQLISSLLIDAENFRTHHERDLVDAPSSHSAVNRQTQSALPCTRKSTNSTDETRHVDQAVESTVAIQTNITRLEARNSSSSETAGPQELRRQVDQEGEFDDDDEADDEADASSTGGAKSREAMDSHESVSLESSIMPSPLASDSEDADEAEEQLTPSSSSSPSSGGAGLTRGPSNDSQDDQEPGANAEAEGAAADESAERREQEAAEAAEAEAADRSALDEQQQAQRQIILAQAQSEAKAIREQQEALLRQQQLQQQMLLRRHQNDIQSSQLATVGDKRRGSQGKQKQAQQTRNSQLNEPEHDARQPARASKQRWAAQDTSQYQHQAPATSSDIQFSDQLESSGAGRTSARVSDDDRYNSNLQQQNRYSGGDNSVGLADDQPEAEGIAAGRGQRNREDEMGVDYSVRRPVFDFAAQQQQLLPQQLPQPSSSDLLSAAQHHYGAHYGSLHGHHKNHYYQFAESHKKGQFDSGFKRGGKKFQISGHSSQHKSHAEGHVKWSGKKGKGMQYWDYKHKGKKGHYGHGHGYGY